MQVGDVGRFFTFAVFNGYLYAGGGEREGGTSARIFRTSNGVDWTLVKDTGEGSNGYIRSLTVFNGYLYGGSYPNGKILRSSNGTTWTEINSTGQGNIRNFAVYKGKLYAGTTPNGKIYYMGNGFNLYSNTKISQNEWTHIAVTYDKDLSSENAKIYINGILDTSKNFTSAIKTNDLNLLIGESYGSSQGGDSSTGEENFNGVIDEVRIWNRTLTEGDVLQDYYSNLYKYDADEWIFHSNQRNLANGDYSYYGYAKNNSGSSNQTETRTLTVYTPPSTSSGGSSETTSRSLTSGIPQISREWNKIFTNKIETMYINQDEIKLTEIRFKVNEELQDVKITVKLLKRNPATNINGRVYQYLELDHRNLNENSIQEMTIGFKVDKKWVDDNFDKNKLYLNRFTDEWKKLPTKLIRETNDYYYYESETSGLSYFAISGETCEINEVRCNGSNLEQCDKGIKWNSSICEHGCNQETSRCNELTETPYEPPKNIIFKFIILGSLTVILLIIVIKRIGSTKTRKN